MRYKIILSLVRFDGREHSFNVGSSDELADALIQAQKKMSQPRLMGKNTELEEVRIVDTERSDDVKVYRRSAWALVQDFINDSHHE